MARVFDVIEYFDETGQEIVHRIPESGSGDFRIGSQLIVRESQAAVFFRDGKALDTFGAGRHTITTANVPLLVDLIGKAFSGQTPFKAEVYFVNLREFLDLKWGTPEPITLPDKELGMVRLRAFGQFAMQITDPQLFVNKIVGTQGIYRNAQIENYLRGVIVSRMTDVLGESKASLLDLPALYDELSGVIKARLADDFKALGITLKALFINNISPTEETAKAIDERAAMGAIGDMQKYLQFKAARAMGDAATAGGEAGSLTGAGVGLGAGVGIGAAMAGAISDALRAGREGQAAAPAAAAAAMVKCPNCGNMVPAGSKFCNNCGQKLAVENKCPNCGVDVPPGSKFCPNCGQKLA
ncbi:MAG: SPFH domain-containing protein [Chloroflexi bacterium]|nr:SPFH domain-containing protein [Chloroflexota bacterium]